MLWSAGEVGGASGVTMAERTREGGCRTSGGGFSIPLGNDEPLPAARLPQRSRVASAHQRKSPLQETNRPIAQIGICRRARDYVWYRTELQQSRGKLPRDNQGETRSHQDCRVIR